MKKWYRNLVITIIVIPLIGIAIATALNVINLKPQPQPTREEYETLKEYCMQIVSGTATVEEIEEKEDVKIKKISISTAGDSLRIEIVNKRCQVAGVFLLSQSQVEIKDGTVFLKNNIICSDALYLTKSLITSKADIICESILGSIIWVILILICFVAIPKEYKKCVEKEAEQKIMT